MVIPASWPDPYYGANPPPGWTIYYGDNFTHRPGHISWQHPVVRPDPHWPIRYGRLSTPAGRKIWPNQVHGLPALPKRNCVVFLKDSWCLDGDDIVPEGHIYAELAASHVPNVLHCLVSGDMECSPHQKTQMQKYSQCRWACQKGLEITPHIHYRLVLDLVGAPLTTFASSKELVQAIHDALISELYPFI